MAMISCACEVCPRRSDAWIVKLYDSLSGKSGCSRTTLPPPGLVIIRNGLYSDVGKNCTVTESLYSVSTTSTKTTKEKRFILKNF
jgi:hypothetical protein